MGINKSNDFYLFKDRMDFDRDYKWCFLASINFSTSPNAQGFKALKNIHKGS